MATPGDTLSESTERFSFTEKYLKYLHHRRFIDKYTRPIRIYNPDNTRQIGWTIKTNCPDRVSIDPPFGVLGPNNPTFFFVRTKPFDPSTDVSADRITIEWVFTPEGAPKQFNEKWFQGDEITRRRTFPVKHVY